MNGLKVIALALYVLVVEEIMGIECDFVIVRVV